MREIKFRGRRVDTGEWVCGNLVSGAKFCEIHGDNGWWSINPETIGQFTGLRDKNGREIYEGDLVRWFYKGVFDGEMHEDVLTVIFHGGAFLASPKIVENANHLCWCGFKGKESNNLSLEKIGNIYDNPEMLEVGE